MLLVDLIAGAMVTTGASLLLVGRNRAGADEERG